MRRVALVSLVLVTTAGTARAQIWDDATPDTIGTTAEWTNKVELADLDGDGWVDILFANGGGYYTAGTLERQRVFRNLGNWSAAPPHFEEITDTVFGAANTRLSRVIKVRDVDGDGDQDIFVGGAHNRTSELWFQQGDGAFTDASANLPATPLALGDAELGDVDGDGDLDLVLADWGGDPRAVEGGQTRLWLNDGDGVFTDATAGRMPVDLVGMSWDMELLDVDDDRDLDVLVSCKLCTRGRLYINDGTGTFADESAARLPAHDNNYEYEAMDIDGDGDLDLATINDGTGTSLGETILVNDNGVFTEETATRLGAADVGEDDNVIAFLDVDSDGDADFVIGSLSGADRLLRNDGTGVFTVDETVMPGGTGGTLGLAVADLDGDGRLDVVQGQGEVTSPDKVQIADTGVAVDTAEPAIRLIHGAEEGDLQVVVRVHDRKSPSLAHDWTSVDLEIVSTSTTEPIPMIWRGEYLWVADVPAGDPDVQYRICATDARDNTACTPPLGLGEEITPDAGPASPDAGDPGGEGGGGGCCDAGAGAPGSAALALFVALVLAVRRRRWAGERDVSSAPGD